MKQIFSYLGFGLPILLGIALVIFGMDSAERGAGSAPMPETLFSAADPDTYDRSTAKSQEQGFVMEHGPVVAVPSLGMQSSLVATGAKDGWLVLPDPPLATWYEKTSWPGAQAGNTLIASHVDYGHGEDAPFSQLHKIQKGAPILVRDFEGKLHTYKTTSIEVYERQGIPPNLFTTTGKPQLVLVTCSGPTIGAGEASYYMYNLVVTAELT